MCAFLPIEGGVAVLKKKKRGVILKITLVFAVVLFACLFYKGYSDYNQNSKDTEKLNTLISQEAERGKQLDKISEESDSLETIEENARSLGYVKANEKIFRNYNDKK